ncbi:hypothetical protein ACH5RR_012249 [Cinchona calisaya]|uniref:Uncharacterized protein n=1 Tax=Cinchona calisaya TaxID=153742 RepID=A0ABD3A7S4_9GENT
MSSIVSPSPQAATTMAIVVVFFPEKHLQKVVHRHKSEIDENANEKFKTIVLFDGEQEGNKPGESAFKRACLAATQVQGKAITIASELTTTDFDIDIVAPSKGATFLVEPVIAPKLM